MGVEQGGGEARLAREAGAEEEQVHDRVVFAAEEACGTCRPVARPRPPRPRAFGVGDGGQVGGQGVDEPGDDRADLVVGDTTLADVASRAMSAQASRRRRRARGVRAIGSRGVRRAYALPIMRQA